jgi:hypothetical protein
MLADLAYLLQGATMGMLFMVSTNASHRQRLLWPVHRFLYRSEILEEPSETEERSGTEDLDEFQLEAEVFRGMSPEAMIMYIREKLATQMEEARKAAIVTLEVGTVVLISSAILILVSGQNVIESAMYLCVGGMAGALIAQVTWLALESSLEPAGALARVIVTKVLARSHQRVT